MLVGYGLEAVLDYGLNNLSGSVYEEWKDIVDVKINADIVVMGSSRGLVSYNSMMIEEQLGNESYNLSFDAASYNLQQSKLDGYLLSNKMPSIIIQNVDFAHFSKSTVIPFESQFFTTINSNQVSKIYKEVPGTLNNFRFKGVSKYTIDNRRIKLSILNLLGLKPKYSFKEKGYNAVSKDYIPDSCNLNRLTKLDYQTQLNGLDKTINYYKDKRFENTKIYFVWAPEYEVRRILIVDASKSIKNIFRSKITKDENMEFIDLQNDEIGNSSIYFYDSFHLNKKGSEIFTQKLISKLKSI